VEHLKSCLVPDLAHVVIAKFKTDGKNILEYSLGVIYSRENVKLSGYLEPNAPFFGILLEHQEDIYQVLSDVFLEELDKLADMRNCCKFEGI